MINTISSIMIIILGVILLGGFGTMTIMFIIHEKENLKGFFKVK